MNKEKNIFIIASIVTLGIFAVGYFLIKPKNKKPTGKGLQIPNILIGDSQTPYVARNSKNFKLISPTGSESSLWKGGMGLSWLLGAVSKFEISPDVRNVGIVIGTNGGFNPKDNISGLITELKRVFPNAKFYAIKGSWGWGGNKNITESKVNDNSFKLNLISSSAILPTSNSGRLENKIFKKINGVSIIERIAEKVLLSNNKLVI